MGPSHDLAGEKVLLDHVSIGIALEGKVKPVLTLPPCITCTGEVVVRVVHLENALQHMLDRDSVVGL